LELENSLRALALALTLLALKSGATRFSLASPVFAHAVIGCATTAHRAKAHNFWIVCVRLREDKFESGAIRARLTTDAFGAGDGVACRFANRFFSL
jgi:hypothetical protein